MTYTFDWKGPKVKANTRAAGVRGLKKAGEHLLGESRQIVPIEEGHLERSGVVSVDEAGSRAAVSFDQKYAVRQHEDLTLKHDTGRSAKYLEGPAQEEHETMMALVAAEIRRALK